LAVLMPLGMPPKMTDKKLQSDVDIILALKNRYHFIVINRDHHIFIERFKKKLTINKDDNQEAVELRFSNALEQCLKLGECRMVPKVTSQCIELFDFSKGQASSKYW